MKLGKAVQSLVRPSLRVSLVGAAVLLATLCWAGAGQSQTQTTQALPSPGAGPVVTTSPGQNTNRNNSNGSATPSTETSQARRNGTQTGPTTEGANPTRMPPRPTEFQRLVQATTGQSLPIYGASMFQAVPSTFAPVTDVPVGPAYVLGPGDEVDLQLSGQINREFRLTVDRTGAISVPELGTVHVAGIAYGQLPAFLNQQLSRLYRNFNLNVNLGSLRTIQVFVTGQALQPGSYSISSLSTLTNAIFASGGPLPQGSLRDIQVNRGGKVITHFDLYDLLLKGDKTDDIPLQTGDVIFIPVVGPQVAVLGSVNNPAIYELKGETTAAQALALAGGKTSVAASAGVRLERVFEHSMLSMVPVDLDATGGTPLQNGDVLSVNSVIGRFRDAVTLRGNVANPGRYVWRPGMRITDVIPDKQALITRDYWRKRNALGQTFTEYTAATPDRTAPGEGALQVGGNAVQGNAANATSSASPSATAPAESSAPTASANGGSNSAGRSVGAALTASSSAFAARNDVVLSAPDIDWSYAVIERQSTKDLTTSLIPFNLGRLVLDGDASQNLDLLPGDVITIFSSADVRVPTSQQTRFVRLEGEFVAAGVYSVLPGETLRGLVRRAGGLTSDAYLYGSEFTRESTRRVEQQRLREYADELEAQIAAVSSSNQARAISATDQQAAAASETGARAAVSRLRNVQPVGRIVLDFKPGSVGVEGIPDLALEDGDRFVVPRVPSSITVEGQVYNANAFVYQAHQRAIDYLHRAGGPDREADKRRVFLLRADGAVVSRQYADVNKATVYPGDTIVVPPILDKRGFFQRVVDSVQMIGNIGFAAASLAVLARQ